MADTKLERIYTVPLRAEWRKVPRYKRARKGVVALKEFIARHMKVPFHDVENVKLDTYLNNEMWFRGPRNAPAHVTVKAIKEGDIVHVTFVDTPAHITFSQKKHARFHTKAEKKAAKVEEKKEEKTEEQKKDESEKEKATAIANEKIAQQQAKEQKRTTKTSTPKINRMALKK